MSKSMLFYLLILLKYVLVHLLLVIIKIILCINLILACYFKFDGIQLYIFSSTLRND